MFKREKMPKPPTDEVALQEAIFVGKDGIDSLKAQKFKLEKNLKEMEQAIADRREQIQELREESARREQRGSRALLKSDIREFEEEIKGIEKQKSHTQEVLEQVKDALMQFGDDDEKDPEEHN